MEQVKRGRGRPKKDPNDKTKSTYIKKPKIIIEDIEYVCSKCGKKYEEKDFYYSSSIFYNGRITFCKNCVEEIYYRLVKKYTDEGRACPEKDAVRRICMTCDIYFNYEIYNSALREAEKKDISIIAGYFKNFHLAQYRKKTYDNTVSEEG